jgi:hypothetical protein
MPRVEEAQLRQQVGFVQHFHRTRRNARPDFIVKQLAIGGQTLGVGRFVAGNNQIDTIVSTIRKLPTCFADQAFGLAARHARQLADQQHPPAGKRPFAIIRCRGNAHADKFRFEK